MSHHEHDWFECLVAASHDRLLCSACAPHLAPDAVRVTAVFNPLG